MKDNVERVQSSNIIDEETINIISDTKDVINVFKDIESDVIEKKGLQKCKHALLQGGSGTIGGSILGSALAMGLGVATIVPGFIIGGVIIGVTGAIIGSRKDKQSF